ncbi:unnamed protein product [Symbiodinium sp. CCMP2592]|nr:unnamed protein product [Symbiodinium sp. CCMP2592]
MYDAQTSIPLLSLRLIRGDAPGTIVPTEHDLENDEASEVSRFSEADSDQAGHRSAESAEAALLKSQEIAEQLQSKLETAEKQVEEYKRRATEVGHDHDSLLSKLLEFEEQAEQRQRSQAKELREARQRQEADIEERLSLQKELQECQTSQVRAQSLHRELQTVQRNFSSEESAQEATCSRLVLAEEALERQEKSLAQLRFELQAERDHAVTVLAENAHRQRCQQHADNDGLSPFSPQRGSSSHCRSPPRGSYTDADLSEAVDIVGEARIPAKLQDAGLDDKSLTSLRERHLKLLHSRLRDHSLRECFRNTGESDDAVARLLQDLLTWQGRVWTTDLVPSASLRTSRSRTQSPLRDEHSSRRRARSRSAISATPLAPRLTSEDLRYQPGQGEIDWPRQVKQGDGGDGERRSFAAEALRQTLLRGRCNS